MEQRFSISREILEMALNYLATKPYNEVAKIISNISVDMKAIPVDEPKTEE